VRRTLPYAIAALSAVNALAAAPYSDLRETATQIVVHAEPKPWSDMIARIEPGAVLRVAPGKGRIGCPKGWMERESGGFVCAKRLKQTDETSPRPSPDDRPDILDGTSPHLLGPGGAKLYRSLGDIDLGRALILLFRNSVLTTTTRIRRNGDEYLRTRRGMLARAANAVALPPPVLSLGVDVPPDAPIPAAVPVPSGALAQVRTAPVPSPLAPDEKWIAVDLAQQLLHAYVGERPVRIVPCSTGINGNTKPGSYRIQWKRRLQTLQLKRGHIRVEDVQWVMYYDKADSIAIHTAYWHDDFGKRASHGCVNVPRDDARWLYEWSSPTPAPEDSETFSHDGARGTRVVVFE
jgi:lipoprotein-anchoring transpeptidase ErfK/SrfK